jgi:hypothetical protein
MDRICCKCKKKKSIIHFYKDSSKPYGYGYSCKECGLRVAKERYSTLDKEARLSYYYKNKQKVRERQKQYEIETKIIRRLYYREWERTKMNNDPVYRIRKTLNNRLRAALKKKKKNNSILELCGVGLELVKQHLESQFKDGMSWDNHGKWHIDHIIPISSFNLLDPEEVKKACHYTNLQPLWSYENLAKGSKIV